MELCSSFRTLSEPFSASFSGPCFSLRTTLMTGWVFSHRRRYVTDLIVSSNATRDGAWCNFHRFFNRDKWALDEVCRVTVRLVVDSLVPRVAVITLAVDDTLCRKRGLGLFGAGMHHDACSPLEGSSCSAGGTTGLWCASSSADCRGRRRSRSLCRSGFGCLSTSRG